MRTLFNTTSKVMHLQKIVLNPVTMLLARYKFQIIFTTGLLLSQLAAIAQGTVSGEANPTMNNTYTYSYTSYYTSAQWTVTKGTVISSWLSGDRTVAYANIKWTTLGTGTITLRRNNLSTIIATKSVNITCSASMTSPTYSSYVYGGSQSSEYCESAWFRIDTTPGSGGLNTYWYSNSGDLDPFYVGTSYTTPTLYATTTYYISTYYGGNTEIGGVCESSRIPVTITISPSPSTPTGGGQETPICGSGVTSLYATVGTNANTLRWYTASSGGSTIYQGAIYNTPSLSSATTYYASSYNTSTGCESASRLAVTATISAVPGVPSATSAARCGTGTVTLSASLGSNGDLIYWYTSGGNYLAQGTSYSPSLSSTTSYQVRTVNSSTSCFSSAVTATATINPIPTVYTVAGGGSYCSGGSGLNVTLSGSQSGVNYQLKMNGSSWGSAVGGTGGVLTWSNLTTGGTYTVDATNASTGCAQAMSSSASITVNALPVQYGVTGGGSYCSGASGVSVGLSGSQGGVNYQLKINGSNSGAAVAGTGGALTWSNQTTSGTYTVDATNASTGCFQSMSGSAQVTMNSLPTVYTVGGGGSYCSGGSGVSVTLSGSQSGVNYQLKINGSNSGSAVAGTGSSLAWNNQTASGTYTVVASNATTGCAQTMSGSASVTINALPTAYTVSGGGSYCSGGSGLGVTLSGSQSGVNYQLKINGSNSGSAVAGTGSSLAWNNQTSSGTYTVVATNASTGCVQTMSGSASVTINALPTVYTVSGGGSYCSGGSGVSVTLSGSQSGVNYQLKINGSNSGAAVAGTGSTLTWANQTTSGTYTVVATNATTACTQTMSSSASVTINALPTVYTVSGGGTSCEIGLSVTLSGSQSGVNYQLKINGSNSGSAVAGTGSSLTWSNQTTSGTYTVVATNATTGCVQTMSGSASLTINALPTVYTVGGGGSYCSGGSGVSVTLNGSQSGVNYQLKVDGSNAGAAISGTGSTLSWSSQTTGGSYTVVATNASTNCVQTMIGSVIVTVNPTPAAPSTEDLYSTFAYGHGQITVGSETSNTRWYNALTGGTQLAQGPSYLTPDISAPTPYYASNFDVNTGCEGPRTAIIANIKPLISLGSQKTEIIRTENITTDSQIAALTDQKSTVISHFDGLLRTVQQSIVKGSPLGKDIVQPIEYDPFGRAAKQYLPYVATTTDGSFQSNYKTAQPAFYNTANDKIADDAFPYAQSVYEASPLGRPVEAGSVGQDFQPGSGHTVRASYSFNTGATASEAEEVRKFNSDGTSTGFYAANTLYRTSSLDENGNTVITFADGTGKTIVKKQQLDEIIDGATVAYLQTYYVYNDFGRIKYIVSPKGVAALRTNGWNLTSILDQYVYQFVYDSRGRVIEKKVPGQDWMYYVYDKLNRLVLVQDAMIRATNKWFYIKYDILGRSVMQGIYLNTDQTTRGTIQTLVDGLYTQGNTEYPENTWHDSRGTILNGYNNVSFPKANSNTSATDVWSVNYYDSYDFDFNGADDYSYTAQSLPGEASQPQGRTDGMSTGGKRIIQGTSTWLYDYDFYDRYGRLIQVRSNNHLSTAVDNFTTSIYDFEGKVLKTKNYHNAGGGRITTVINTYEYDTQGRLVKVYQSNNGAIDQLITQYEFNELGQLVDKKLHNTGGSNFLQSVDYRYNIRGQLLSINNGQLAVGNSNDDTNDYFGMELLYNTVESGLSNTQYFNGNISAIKWKGPGTTSGAAYQRSYKYTYDKANRLETATSQMYSGSLWNKEAGVTNESMNYDHNGNILSLQRNQRQHQLSGVIASYASQQIDNLTYTYDAAIGDRLKKVEDGSGQAEGFNNLANEITEYNYDVNGNVTEDKNKGISSIAYNFLGKPAVINFTDGRKTEYTYDAAGSKLTMKGYQGSTLLSTTDYVGGFVYDNGNLGFFSSPEGRVTTEPLTSSSSCVTCDALKTNVTNYINQYGQQAITNIAQLTTYLNTALSVTRTEQEYKDAIKKCNILNVSVNFSAGNNSYVSFGNQPQYLMGTDNFTIEAWVNFPSSIGTGVYPIVSNQDYLGVNSYSFTGLWLGIYSQKIYFTVGDGTDYSSVYANVLPTANTWHHIAVQRIGNQASSFKIFVDGVEVAKTIFRQGLSDGNIDQDGVEAMKIGSRAGSWDNTTFQGSIKQVRLYKRLLSGTEIQQSYGYGCPANPSDLSQLLLWAPLNEGLGNTISDYSSYGQQGSFVGSGLTWTNAVNASGCIDGSMKVLCPVQSTYQYAIGDHQGNTRVVFTSATPAPVAPQATFEGDSNDGASQYQNIDATKVVTFISANHTPSGSKVVRMNQSYMSGPAKSLKVYPGDKVDMEVWAYYEGSTGWGSTSTGISAFITNVAAAFGGINGGGGESSAIYNGVNSAYSAAGMAGNQGDTRPSAYLNYILFDKDYKFLDMGWQLVPSSANMAKQQMSIPTVNIKEPGYIFVYLSYEAESNNWMYFDDFKVTHTKTNVIQYNEFYPFGLSASTSWTRENNKNDFLYNAGSELNQTSGWYDLPFRNYDAALGRFMQVDPMSVSEQATYQYAGNNPVYFNDPMGLVRQDANDPTGRKRMIARQVDGFKTWSTDGGNGGVLGDEFDAGGGSGHTLGDYRYQDELLRKARSGDPDATEEYMETYGTKISPVNWGKYLPLPDQTFVFAVIGENGVNYGYDIVLDGLGNITYAARTRVAHKEGGWVENGPFTVVYDNRNLEGSSWNDLAGIGVDFTEFYTLKAVASNFAVLQAESNALRLGLNYSNEISKTSSAIKATKWAGRVLGAYSAYMIDKSYNEGRLSTSQMLIEQSSNTFATFGGIYGASWGIGWEIGRTITTINAYQDWKHSTWLPMRQSYLGY